jgi:hypothetical protein
MIVDFGVRKVKIQGELTATPAFYGYINSIKNWEAPFENSVITELERQDIIEQISEYNNLEFPVFLENW